MQRNEVMSGKPWLAGVWMKLWTSISTAVQKSKGKFYLAIFFILLRELLNDKPWINNLTY
jgi:hypothetical protein